MSTELQTVLPWWSSASVRICHPDLDPQVVTKSLNAIPSIEQPAGTSKAPYRSRTDPHKWVLSAGYLCLAHRENHPARPDAVLIWADRFVFERRTRFVEMLDQQYDIDIYVGIHCSVLTLGFDLPPMPTLSELQIQVGIEFFGR